MNLLRPVSIITPSVLAAIAADWSEAELHAAAAVLTDLLHDRRGAVPVPVSEPETTARMQDRVR